MYNNNYCSWCPYFLDCKLWRTVNISDFVGTWYFRGNKNKPCYIRLLGINKLGITNERGIYYEGYLKNDILVSDRIPEQGILSSDHNRISWTNGEIWER